MATRAPKIPQSSWDHHKDTILSLYISSEVSLPALVQAMDRDYGFSATASQFEAQLKVWNARKNLKRHEWEDILPKIDSLTSQGVRFRVVISGHPVSMNRVDRARRHCKGEYHSKKRRREETDFGDEMNHRNASDVSIETQDQHGNWSRYGATPNASAISLQSQTNSSAILDFDTQGQAVEHHGERSGQMNIGSANYQFLENFDLPRITNSPPQLFSFHVPGLVSDNWLAAGENETPIQSMDLSFAGPEAQLSQSFVQHESYADIMPPNLELLNSPLLASLTQFPLGAVHLEDLPFQRFEREFGLKHLLAMRPSPMHDCRLLFGAQKLVSMFVHEAAVAMTNVNENSLEENFHAAWLTLHTLRTSFPRARQEDESNRMTQARQDITEVELYRLLLFSSANGFIGMGDIPIGTVFRFFNHDSKVIPLLSRLFRDSPGHLAKGLAENLFRAAIESGHHETVRFFLQEGLVDVDSTLCFANGGKYTPIQRAAELQKLKVVRELLQFRPNVNKTFVEPRPDLYYNVDHMSALGCLIQGICPMESTARIHITFSPEYLEAVDGLVEAGAEVRVSFIDIALRRFARMDLAKKLLSKFPPSDHSQAWSEGLPIRIVEELPDEDAKEAVNKIFSDCEQVGCGQCLIGFSDEVNEVIVRGAKRGHIQLVRSLFQYAKSPTQILCAAIRSGNRELTDFVLAQKPNISQATPEWLYEYQGATKRYTTPLAEAIGASDGVLIELLKRRGAFEHFESDISAAVKAGDVDYVKKLLVQYPSAPKFEMANGLSEAIMTQREDIVQLLLESGATSRYWSEVETFLREAYRVGNKSIISSLMLTFPDLTISEMNGHTFESMQLGNVEMLSFFQESGRLESHVLTQCIDLALKSAVKGNSNMLPTLLNQTPPTKTCMKLFGTGAVKQAVTQGHIEALEMLLDCKAIDIKSMELTHESFIGRKYYAPLAEAINRDAASQCHDFPLTTRLLDAGCDVDGIVFTEYSKQQHSNITPLLVAIKAGSKNLVQFLMDHGADINKDAINRIQRTPLQAAAEKGRLDIVELLLHNGADINGKPAGSGGGTALQCAAMGGNCNIAALLLDCGALLDAPPSTFDGRWPLEAAAEHGRLDMIQFLWNVSVIGFPIEQCLKAMKLAEEMGHRACKELILELAVTFGITTTLEGSG
ncbi:ankyrin [Hypoxylon sp. FL0890]|nr:ankyrin [Hypoxylon sp. FL0890]